jgi:adenylate cyclase
MEAVQPERTPPRAADAAFEQALAREIAASERIRALSVVGILALLSVMDICVAVLAPGTFSRIAQEPVSDLLPLMTIAPFLFYESVVLWVLRFRLRSGLDVPTLARFATATIETLLTTAFLWLARQHVGPAITFATWTPMLYFVFIVVSTLRLNFTLPFYTGAVSGLSLLGVARAFIDPADPATLNLWLMQLPKAGLMVASGVIAGLVGMRLGAKFRQAAEQTVLRERVTNLFGQHVSPAVLERLLSAPTDIADEAREVCVMFLDIRDFTAEARMRSPGEVVAFLNSAFAFMIEAVDRQGGIVNKFLGDGVMAIFGAPLVDPEAARHAVAASREILAEIDRRGLADGPWPLRVGIGLHFGAVVTGNIGSPRRKEFTAIGDAVNLASRFEQLTKAHPARLIASEAVVAALNGAGPSAAPLGSVDIKGYPAPIPIWRLD